jgi:uncharacterized membrane protein HdeD (DUF308 family)
MVENETVLFGIPIPSDNPLFLTIVGIHIVLGIVCVVSGAVAMLTKKGSRNHTTSGKIYYWGLVLVFISVIPLSIMRWPHNNHLFVLGAFSMLSAFVGRRVARTKKDRWPRGHTILMGLSYVLLLTAFYVDNGRNLPFWNLFPQLFFWVFPAAIGLPIIVYALRKHPLNQRQI